MEEIRETGTPGNPVVISRRAFPDGAHLIGCSYVDVLWNDVSNPNGRGIYITPGKEPSHHINVAGNNVHDCAMAGIDMDGLPEGLDYYEAFYSVANNTITRCMGHGITASGREQGGALARVLIENNDVSYIKRLGPAWGYGIYLCFVYDSPVVGNRSHHNDWSGIHCDGNAGTGFGCRRNAIEENECSNNAGPACELEVSQENAVRGNRFWCDEPLPEGADPWRNNGVLVTDQGGGNLIEGNYFYGKLRGPAISIDNRSPGTSILWNTILAGTVSVHVEDDECAKGVRIFDNILVRVIHLPSWAAEALIKADYNCHVTRALVVDPGDGATPENPYVKWGLGTWQVKGKCPHSITANPFFMDVTALDFRLSADSPCRGSGEDFSNIGAAQEEETDVITVKKQVELVAHAKLGFDTQSVPHVFQCDAEGEVIGPPVADFDIAKGGKLVVLPVE